MNLFIRSSRCPLEKRQTTPTEVATPKLKTTGVGVERVPSSPQLDLPLLHCSEYAFKNHTCMWITCMHYCSQYLSNLETKLHFPTSLSQSRRKGPPYPPARAAGKKGAPKSDRVRLLRHIETPELNSPRTYFTHFFFQYSYLSNMSNQFTFTRPITSWRSSYATGLQHNFPENFY